MDMQGLRGPLPKVRDDERPLPAQGCPADDAIPICLQKQQWNGLIASAFLLTLQHPTSVQSKISDPRDAIGAVNVRNEATERHEMLRR